MTLNERYHPPMEGKWTGRIDDSNDSRTLRIHQSVKLLDLSLSEIKKVTSVEFVLLGFCCDEGIRRNQGRIGAVEGPDHIRKALAPLPSGPQLSIHDAGDIHCEDGNLESSQELLSTISSKLLDKGYFPLVLGGGHEVALGHFNGFKRHTQRQGKRTWGIVNIDAHFDLRPVRDLGNSGTMFSQIAKSCEETRDEFRYLVLGIQKSGNTELLFDRANELNVKYLLANQLHEPEPENDEYIKTFIEQSEDIYLTLCSDVFSTAHVPGVSAPQALGLSPQRVLSLLMIVFASGKVRCMDIAEISPRYDHDERSSRVAARMLYEVMQYLNEASIGS